MKIKYDNDFSAKKMCVENVTHMTNFYKECVDMQLRKHI